MISDLPTIPDFDIPLTTVKPLSTKDYYLLSAEGIRRLHDAGRLEEILSDPRRKPVSKPFTLA